MSWSNKFTVVSNVFASLLMRKNQKNIKEHIKNISINLERKILKLLKEFTEHHAKENTNVLLKD